MSKRYTRPCTCGLIAAVLMFALSGCEQKESKPAAPEKEKPAATTEKPAAAAEKPAEATEKANEGAAMVAADVAAGVSEAAIKLDAMAKMKAMPLLAAADMLDGKDDKIITRCAGCKFGMDGSKEHTLEIEGYTLYFCKEDCKKQFAEDPAKSVLAMEIPGD